MNNLESGKSFSNVLAKKMAAVALVAALTVGSAGCNPKQIDSGENNNPPITGTVTPETNPTNTKPIETKTARQLELEALLTKAPEVDGLTKKIEGDKVIYTNEVGEYKGEFNKNVTVEGKETGGVALLPEIALVLLNKELSKIPTGEKRLKIIVPLDISELDDGNNVEISQAVYPKNNEKFLLINPSKSFNLIDTVPGDHTFGTTNNSADLYFKSETNEYNLSLVGFVNPVIINEVTNENLMNYINFNISEKAVPLKAQTKTSFGNIFSFGSGYPEVKINSPMIIVAGVIDFYPTEISDLLTVGDDNTPVFIRTSEK